MKKEANEAKKKEKQESQPKDTKSELDPTKYFENRKEHIIERKTKNDNPFPHKFEVTFTNPQFIEKFGSITKKGEWLSDCPVSIAGRVFATRSQSGKLKFYDIISDNKKIQVYSNLRYLNISNTYITHITPAIL